MCNLLARRVITASLLSLLVNVELPAQKPRPATAVAFVRIAAGEFLRGSADGLDNEKPAHRATISMGFEMGKHEVTQARWEAVMGDNPSQFKGADLPVEQVSWEDVQRFIQAMNANDDGWEYRLPTEAEWEYAARAGTTGDYGGTGNLSEMGWYNGNSEGRTHPVGEKRANAWGLHDMHGNVWEGVVPGLVRQALLPE